MQDNKRAKIEGMDILGYIADDTHNIEAGSNEGASDKATLDNGYPDYEHDVMTGSDTDILPHDEGRSHKAEEKVNNDEEIKRTCQNEQIEDSIKFMEPCHKSYNTIEFTEPRHTIEEKDITNRDGSKFELNPDFIAKIKNTLKDSEKDIYLMDTFIQNMKNDCYDREIIFFVNLIQNISLI